MRKKLILGGLNALAIQELLLLLRVGTLAAVEEAISVAHLGNFALNKLLLLQITVIKDEAYIFRWLGKLPLLSSTAHGHLYLHAWLLLLAGKVLQGIEESRRDGMLQILAALEERIMQLTCRHSLGVELLSQALTIFNLLLLHPLILFLVICLNGDLLSLLVLSLNVILGVVETCPTSAYILLLCHEVDLMTLNLSRLILDRVETSIDIAASTLLLALY